MLVITSTLLQITHKIINITNNKQKSTITISKSISTASNTKYFVILYKIQNQRVRLTEKMSLQLPQKHNYLDCHTDFSKLL